MLNTAFLIVATSSKRADATAHAHVRRYPALLHDSIAIIRLQPHYSFSPGRRGIRIGSTIQLVSPGALRSNPHSSSLPLSTSVRHRGFLPWGFPDICPQTSLGRACSDLADRYRATLNKSGDGPTENARRKAIIANGIAPWSTCREFGHWPDRLLGIIRSLPPPARRVNRGLSVSMIHTLATPLSSRSVK
jgi:hypothetical protein